MIKSYTDLEQSKKLSKILPIESADMGWNVFVDGTSRILPINDWDLVKDGSRNVKFYHAWSLTVLLDIIPKRIKGYNVLRIDIGEKDFSMWYDEVGCGVNNSLPDITANNPIDACYEMIIILHELNLL